MTAPFDLDADNFNTHALADRPMPIDFRAPWCGPCQTMGPVFDEMAREFMGMVDFAKVNTDKQKTLARYFGILTLPTLVFVHRQRIVARKARLATRRELRAWIFEALSRATES